MMLKITNKIALFLMLVITVSCIEISQEIEINKNRSGKYTVKIDMGMLQFANLNETMPDALGFLSSIKTIPSKAIEKLKDPNCKGISNIENISKDEKGVYGFRFEFDNYRALNKALYSLADQQKVFLMPNFIKIKRSKVIVKDIAPFIQKANEKMSDNSEMNFLNDQIMQFISFTTKIHLPKKVKKVKNIRSQINDKSVILQSSMGDLIKGVNYGNNIKY